MINKSENEIYGDLEDNLVDRMFMDMAYKQAQQAYQHDEVPVGAVIAKDDTLIAKAYNQVETLKDPTAHAEMIAITQASHKLSSKWLYDCTMYITLEPCSMCAGAIVLARVKRLCIGTLDSKTGACGSILNITQHASLNHNVDIDLSLLDPKYGDILTSFFQEKRNLQK